MISIWPVAGPAWVLAKFFRSWLARVMRLTAAFGPGAGAPLRLLPGRIAERTRP